MMRRKMLLTAVAMSALFAFYLPSSSAGTISYSLSVASIVGTCGLLALMLALSFATAPLLNIVVALLIPALLLGFTVTSPFRDYSPGVMLLYFAQSLLFMLNLGAARSRRIEYVFQAIVGISLVFGCALALDVQAADRLVLGSYNAFYQDLGRNMVVNFNKPVLTFATHSMAGYMIYLLFVLELRSWQARGDMWRLLGSVGLLGLLWRLQSTTSLAFLLAGTLELSWRLWRRFLPRRAQFALAAAVLLAGGLRVGLDASNLMSRARSAIVGDRVSGYASRYADGGLLASNFEYLSRSPFTPIGASATSSLYLGDSGIVVNLLRGSMPLVLLVYGGLWLFLATNIPDIRDATQLWLATVVFETGFTPLMYFRFVGFAPFLVVYLQSLAALHTPTATEAYADPGGVSARESLHGS